jgi:hypothetical protein
MLHRISELFRFSHFICEQGKQREKRQAEQAPEGFVTGFQNTGQFLFASEVTVSFSNLHPQVYSAVVQNKFFEQKN